MAKDIFKLPPQQQGAKNLQLRIDIKDEKLITYYNDSLLSALNIKEEDLLTIAEKLSAVVCDEKIKQSNKEVVSLYVMQTRITSEDPDDFDIKEELKAIGNRKAFKSEQLEKINNIVITDISRKLGASEEDIDSRLKS